MVMKVSAMATRVGGDHPRGRCRGHRVRKQQVVKPIVDNIIVDVDVFRVAVVGGTDIEQRCCPAFGLQQFADQTD
jgi:hypothetical protein